MPEVHPPPFTSATPRAQGAPAGWHVPIEPAAAPNTTVLTDVERMAGQLAEMKAENRRLQALLAGNASAEHVPVDPGLQHIPLRRASTMSDASMGMSDRHITTVTPQLAKHPMLKTHQG